MAQLSDSLVRPLYPALDGLRAVAVLMVFSLHYEVFFGNAAVLGWGWIGVDLFFVISGFLITGILFDTLHKPNFFRNFYIRRSLRIFPLFYGFWIVMFAATTLLHRYVYIEWNRYLFSTFFYVGNFFTPGAKMNWYPTPFAVPFITASHPDPRMIEIGHFWSLCVEEQFYMIWPLVIWLVRSRRHLLRICLVVIMLAPLLRWALFMYVSTRFLHTDFLYYSTYTRIDTLLIGATVALWLRGPAHEFIAVRRYYILLCTVPPALLAICLLSPANRWPIQNDPIVMTLGYTLIGLTSAGVLLAAIHTPSLISRAFRSRPLIAIGRISYGIYFFHALPLQAVGGRTVAALVHQRLYLIPIFTAIFTYAAAWLSFRYFESPFLRLKERFAPRRGAVPDPAPAPITFTPVIVPSHSGTARP